VAPPIVSDSVANPGGLLVGRLQRLLTLGMTFGTVAEPVALVDETIDGLTDSPDQRSRLLEPMRLVARQLTDEPRFNRTLALARQAHELAAIGEHEAHACLTALQAFATLAQPRPQSAPDSEHETELRSALTGLSSTAPNEGDRAGSYSRLLESIVASAAQAIGARYGSLFLIDEETQELVFEVSLRERLEDLRSFRVPLGQGIAGLVAVSAQPIAVSDVRSDPRHAADIAEQTGYTPKSMLCVPLQHGERVIGVLELLDKTDDTETFSMSDMQALGPFAHRAAQTIEESRRHQSVLRLVRHGLRQIAGVEINDASEDPDFRDRLELGELVLQIASLDTPLTSVCTEVMRSLIEYAHSRER
jgi:putative methionine-R-sulfoxide reductase with GAF domain